MTTRPEDTNDATPDAWLRSALRHAPDARVEPPAQVDEAILRTARAAVAPAQPVSPLLAVLRSMWDALARPPVAAAFASLMLATAIGLMWIDRPELDEAAAPKIERPAAAPAAAPAPADDERPSPAASQAAPASAASGAIARDERRAASPPAPRRASDASAPAAKPAPAPAAAPVQPAQDSAGAAAAEQAAPAREEVASQAALRAELEARADAARRRAADQSAARSADQVAKQARAPAPAAAAMAPPPALPRVAAWRESIALEPSRWQWSVAGAAARPAVDGLASWLLRVELATRGAWRASPAEPSASDATLQLMRDGQPAGTIRLDATRVLVIEGGRAEQAALDAADAAALRAALEALSR